MKTKIIKSLWDLPSQIIDIAYHLDVIERKILVKYDKMLADILSNEKHEVDDDEVRYFYKGWVVIMGKEGT